MLIGLSGKAGVGKDTVAHYLVLKYNFQRLGFADYLKQVAASLGWNMLKDVPGRRYLQQLGQTVRANDSDFWIRMVQQHYLKVKNYGVSLVIPDVRFLNEVEWIKNEGGVVIRVYRDEQVTDTDVSETELDKFDFEYRIESRLGDFNHLYKQVDEFMSRLPR